jgi:hypothetical protein
VATPLGWGTAARREIEQELRQAEADLGAHTAQARTTELELRERRERQWRNVSEWAIRQEMEAAVQRRFAGRGRR